IIVPSSTASRSERRLRPLIEHPHPLPIDSLMRGLNCDFRAVPGPLSTLVEASVWSALSVSSSDQSDTTFLRNKTRCLDEPWKTQILYFGGVFNLGDRGCGQFAEIFSEDCFSKTERDR